MSKREPAGMIYLYFSVSFTKITYALYTEDNNICAFTWRSLNYHRIMENCCLQIKIDFLENRVGIIKNHSKDMV